MTFGLKNEDIECIIKAVTRFPEIKQAIIFGSRAKDSYQKGSDIDLAIKGKEITYNIVNRINTILNEELPLPYFFDVLHYEEIGNENLTGHIDRVGKIIYSVK